MPVVWIGDRLCEDVVRINPQNITCMPPAGHVGVDLTVVLSVEGVEDVPSSSPSDVTFTYPVPIISRLAYNKLEAATGFFFFFC